MNVVLFIKIVSWMLIAGSVATMVSRVWAWHWYNETLAGKIAQLTDQLQGVRRTYPMTFPLIIFGIALAALISMWPVDPSSCLVYNGYINWRKGVTNDHNHIRSRISQSHIADKFSYENLIPFMIFTFKRLFIPQVDLFEIFFDIQFYNLNYYLHNCMYKFHIFYNTQVQ